MSGYTGVAICGRAGSGKSTLAKAILELRHDLTAGSFAQALKWDLQKIGIVKGDPGFREIAQAYGTDHARVKYGPDYWVERLRGGTHSLATLARLVIDDVRFPNEVAACRDDGLLIVRVEANVSTRENRLGYACPEHESETALDEDEPDVLLYSDWQPAENLARVVCGILERGPVVAHG